MFNYRKSRKVWLSRLNENISATIIRHQLLQAKLSRGFETGKIGYMLISSSCPKKKVHQILQLCILKQVKFKSTLIKNTIERSRNQATSSGFNSTFIYAKRTVCFDGAAADDNKILNLRPLSTCRAHLCDVIPTGAPKGWQPK